MKKIIIWLFLLAANVHFIQAQQYDDYVINAEIKKISKGSFNLSYGSAFSEYFKLVVHDTSSVRIVFNGDISQEFSKLLYVNLEKEDDYSTPIYNLEIVDGIGLILETEVLFPGNYLLALEGSDIDRIYIPGMPDIYYFEYTLQCSEHSANLGLLKTDSLYSAQFTSFWKEISFRKKIEQDIKLTLKCYNGFKPEIVLLKKEYENEYDVNSNLRKIDDTTYEIDLLPQKSGDFDLIIHDRNLSINEMHPQSLEYILTCSENMNSLSFSSGDTAPSIETTTYMNEIGSLFSTQVQYFNGLGFPVQLVERQQSPDKKDIVTLTEYDAEGREEKKWLPVVAGRNGEFWSHAFEIRNNAKYRYNDEYPFSKYCYEAFSDGRVVKQYNPGYEWHRYGQNRSDILAYTSNNADSLSCLHFEIDSALGRLCVKGVYPSGRLFVTLRKDEDNNLSYSFTDIHENKIMTRQLIDGEYNDTYYVYDRRGNLCYVLPPALVDTTHLADNDEQMREYAYVYRYDNRNRCIAKKLPGIGWNYFAYDRSNQLIFSQDAENRKKGEWHFSIPDAFGRVVAEGFCRDTVDIRNGIVTAVYDTLNGDYQHYSFLIDSVALDLDVSSLLKLNYYDGYDFFANDHFAGLAFDISGQGERYGDDTDTLRYCHKGLLTGTITYVLDTASILYSALYYDKRQRLIQTQSVNHLGDKETGMFEYSYTDMLLRKQLVHTPVGETEIRETYDYTYDHANRLLAVKHRLNNQSAMILSAFTYDDFGRMILKEYPGVEALQYQYNIRNFSTAIIGGKFQQTLQYESPMSGAVPNYSGNVSAMTWKSGSNGISRGYKFSYDALSRLTDAVYGEGDSLNLNVNRFNEQIMSYDKQGNILGLQRYGQISSTDYGLINELTLTYKGNKLICATDSATNSAYANGFEFRDGVTLPVEYSYDDNGNLIQDLNKNILDIQYNCLNLPCRIEFVGGNSISYLYAADGTKLRATHILGNDITVTDYCDNLIYENGVAKILLVEGGYVSLSDNKYHFYIQDHQGNNRVVVDQNGTVEERNDYYPFGGLMSSLVSNSVQSYKYNGKELDRKGGLDWYDYGARYYDAALGRWHVVDPLAEKYYGLTPYNYCINNPVLLIDPNGMWPTWGGIKSGLNNALGVSLSFVNGAVSAIVDNLALGNTSLRESGIYSNASAYNAGQDFGDVASVIMGGGEVLVGAGKATGGVFLAPETGGISLSATVEGAAIATHGSIMATSGAQKLFSRKGRVNENSSNSDGYSKSSGKNEKHSNLDRRNQASNDYAAAKEKYDNLNSKANKTPQDKAELNKLRKEKEHLKKQMDYAGDHDHQRGRGGI